MHLIQAELPFIIAKHGVEYPVLQDVLCNSKIRLQ